VTAVGGRQENGVPVENRGDRPPLPESESTNVWPDEAAEAAFFAEARASGEPTGPVTNAATEAMEETDNRGLPPLDDLVKRIPPEVREILDDLFRAKFTSVRRVPRNVLKE
jgi:hypothetical protein